MNEKSDMHEMHSAEMLTILKSQTNEEYVVDILQELNFDPEEFDDLVVSAKEIPQIIYRILYLLDAQFNNQVPDHKGTFRLNPYTVANIFTGLITKRKKLSAEAEKARKTLEKIAYAEKALKQFYESVEGIYKTVFIEEDLHGEAFRLSKPRICQVPGCNNLLDNDQGHNAKYCRECHSQGIPKKMSNRRYWKRVRGDFDEE